MFLQIILLLITFGLLLKWRRLKFSKLAEYAPCRLPNYPLVGMACSFIGTDEDRMNVFKDLGRQAFEQGGMVSGWMVDRLYLVMSDPKLIEVISKNCLEKDYVMSFSHFVLGNGSLMAPVSIWRPRRKILVPTFRPRNLRQFVEVFARQSRIMSDLLTKKAGGDSFSLWSYITRYTMDSVCETTLGININAQMNSDQPFLLAFETFCETVAMRVCQPWLYPDSVWKLLPPYRRMAHARDVMHKMVEEIIQAKRESIQKEKLAKTMSHEIPTSEEGTPTPKTFLDLLIESSGGERGYSDVELREEILVLVMAGTDTSAVGIAFTALMLARHPDVQDIVYQELQNLYGDSDRLLVADDLPELRYLDAVIRETLRLYPPVPISARKVVENFTLPSGVTLVEGCGIIINMWGTHRNPQYWGEDADRFRPERFLEGPLQHPAQFMPFSTGPRNCLGYQYAMQSMKTALATLCRRYRFLSPPGALYEPRVKFDIMMKDVHNFMTILETRKTVTA